MKITQDQVQYLKENYKQYGNNKLAKSLKCKKVWVEEALGKLKLERSKENKIYIQKQHRSTPPSFEEKTNIPYIVSSDELSYRTKLLLAIIPGCLLLIYSSMVPHFPAGMYGVELTICASQGELPSSPCSPLYLLFTNLFCSVFTWGTLAWRVQIFSAIISAVTCWLLIHVFYRILHNLHWAVFLTLLYAFSLNWWQNSITTSPITLAMLFWCLFLYFCISWYEDPQESKLILSTLGLIGAVTSHSFFLIFVPAAIIFYYIAHKQYKLSREVIFGIVVLLFLGMNLFLLMPMYSWSQEAPTFFQLQGFQDTVFYMIGKQGFSDLRLQSTMLFLTSFWEQISFLMQSLWLSAANSLFLAVIFILTIFFLVHGLRKLKQNKSGLAILFVLIVFIHLIFCIVVSLWSFSRETVWIYFSMPFVIVVYVSVGFIFRNVGHKWLYFVAIFMLFFQIINHFGKSKPSSFFHQYSSHIIKNLDPEAILVSDDYIYPTLLYYKSPSIKVVKASSTDKRYLTDQYSKRIPIYTTDKNFRLSGLRLQRRGFVWRFVSHQIHLEKKTLPQLTTPTLFLNARQKRIAFQYYSIKALDYLEQGKIDHALEQIAQIQDKKEIQTLFMQRAQRLSAEKKYNKALDIYLYFNKRYPKATSFLLAIARIKNVQGKIEEAEKFYNSILKQFPNHFYASIELALIYEKTKRLSLAKAIYENLVDVYPKNPYPYKKLAQIYSPTNKKQAQELLDKSEKLKKKKQPQKFPSPNLHHPKRPDINNLLPKIPKPQDFYPKNTIPGEKRK